MAETPDPGGADTSEAETDPVSNANRVIVVGPDGEMIGEVLQGSAATVETGDDQGQGITDLIEQPAKVMRIGSMIKQLLEEVRAAPLDEAARTRLRDIHTRSLKELQDGLSPELVEELDRLALPFTEDSHPSEAELRIAQAQLVGWLEGLFHGIQTALFAQQMAARAAFEEVRRRAISAGPGAVPQMSVEAPSEEGAPGARRPPPGPYL
ncbi:MAG: bacterial proteasome activator family protein [Candidatus Nanopelagicales bacterium]|nr:bacterial proteasome activator family protein [Candidatus Nanopelagicales bacterium]